MSGRQRRQHGEGSLYQRGRRGGDHDSTQPGQWVAVADLGWRGGKRDRREFTGATMEEARDRRREFLDRLRDGFTIPRGRPLMVSDWMLHWLHNIAANKVETTTIDTTYRQKVTELICPWFERIPLAELSEEDIEAWHAQLQRAISPRTGRPLSASTIGQAHRIMSRAIKVAVARGNLPRNPCSNVTPPASARRELEVPTAKEIALILKRCATWPGGARWVLALKTGLRQGEVLALRWPDVKLSEPASVTVRQSAARTSAGLVYKQPKSAKSRRTVPLTGEAVAALRDHRKNQPVQDLGGLVFTNSRGGPVHPRADYNDWHALLDDLGIRHYRVHDCRHAVATMLLERGVDVRIVQEIMGWSTLAMTEVYQHVRPALQQRALDALDVAQS